MEWINVNTLHFAEIAFNGNGHSWKSDLPIDEPFLVAVETNKGWDIEKVVLTDQIGLQCFSDGETSHYGWDITDVKYWCKLENPK